MSTLLRALLSSTVALPLLAPYSWADTSLCRVIKNLPTTITTPGKYCLNGNLDVNLTSGNAITVAADFVTIDFNGYEMRGGLLPTLFGGSTTKGVGGVNRRGVTIRNGIIRSFSLGVNLVSDTTAGPGMGVSAEHLIEDMYFDQVIAAANMCRTTDLDRVACAGGGTVTHNIVRNCRITNANIGVNFICGPDGECELINNAMWLGGASAPPGSVGTGLYMSGPGVVVGNRIVGPGTGTGTGIFMESPTLFTTVYRDNIVVGMGIAYDGGVNAGNNFP